VKSLFPSADAATQFQLELLAFVGLVVVQVAPESLETQIKPVGCAGEVKFATTNNALPSAEEATERQ